MKQNETEVNNKYPSGAMTLLELMALLAILGLLLTWVAHWFFSA